MRTTHLHMFSYHRRVYNHFGSSSEAHCHGQYRSGYSPCLHRDHKLGGEERGGTVGKQYYMWADQSIDSMLSRRHTHARFLQEMADCTYGLSVGSPQRSGFRENSTNFFIPCYIYSCTWQYRPYSLLTRTTHLPIISTFSGDENTISLLHKSLLQQQLTVWWSSSVFIWQRRLLHRGSEVHCFLERWYRLSSSLYSYSAWRYKMSISICCVWGEGVG